MARWELTPSLSIADDTLNGVADWETLTAELAALAITYPFLDHCSSGDVLQLFFDGTLDSGDQTTVLNAVAAHTGVPGPRGTRLKSADGKVLELTGVSGGAPVWTEIT